MKTCTICKENKETAEFSKHSGRSDGLQSHCKDCNKAQSKLYYEKNAEKHKNKVKEYFKMKPRKICAVCKKRTVKFKQIDNTYFCDKCSLRNSMVSE